jgi:hypothetical protein
MNLVSQWEKLPWWRQSIPDNPVKNAQTTEKKLKIKSAITPRARWSLVDSSVSLAFSIDGK